MIYFKFVESIERFNILCGVLFNIVLLYLIYKYSRPNLGSYKMLLYVFAAYDVFISLVHAVIDHKVVLLDTMFIAVSRSFAESRLLTSFFCASFTVPFALVIINFLYRFWAVKYPERIRFFSSKLFGSLLAIFCFLSAAAWYCAVFFGCTGQDESHAKTRARMAYRRQYGQIIMEGYVLMEHWKDGQFNLRPALILLYFDFIIIGGIIVASILAYRTLLCIRKAEQMSGYTRVLQGRLLVALCAQTAVPVLCAYIPFFIVLTCPFFGISAYALTASMVILHSCFPPVDAIVIIALMADYRVGLKTMLRRVVQGKEANRSTATVVTTRSITVSHMSSRH